MGSFNIEITLILTWFSPFSLLVSTYYKPDFIVGTNPYSCGAVFWIVQSWGRWACAGIHLLLGKCTLSLVVSQLHGSAAHICKSMAKGRVQFVSADTEKNEDISPRLLKEQVYAQYIMRNAGLEEAQAGIKIARRNINNLRYADDTTFTAESEEELKILLRKVKEESEKVGLKLNIQKTKIMASGPITSWEIDGETVEAVSDFILGGSKITADGDCSHEIKRCFLLGRKVV